MSLDPNRKLDRAPDHVPPHLVIDWDFHDEACFRRFGLSNAARLIKHERDFLGAPLKAGDIMMVPISLACRGERNWGTDALDISFQRTT